MHSSFTSSVVTRAATDLATMAALKEAFRACDPAHGSSLRQLRLAAAKAIQLANLIEDPHASMLFCPLAEYTQILADRLEGDMLLNSQKLQDLSCIASVEVSRLTSEMLQEAAQAA